MEDRRNKSKVVLLGDASVGKTSIVTRFVNNRFSDSIEATVGAAFSTRALALDTQPPRTVKFEIWDTAGQERFRSLAPLYYRGAAAAIVVCDLTAPETFNRAQDWISELREGTGSQDCVIALVCNKSDLPAVMSTFAAKEYAQNERLIYMETSAVTGEGVQQVFEALGMRLVEKEAFEQQNAHEKEKEVLRLEAQSEGRSCCSSSPASTHVNS
eukprot:GEMP01061597.1.p1 GENE.GEMP01061597.1~~GEMP01061597.1.p1  ORF type:complete len:213 (+),score=49.58 GEMP01061597.1:66-704(+)